MAALLDRLLPPVASNAYHGPRVAVIGLALLTALMLFRSGVHLFAPDGGMQSIATMIVFEGDPDPDRVIHSLASLWGMPSWRARPKPEMPYMIPKLIAFA
mgnify:CR=1 FL=1